MALYYYNGKDCRVTPQGARIHRSPSPWASLAAIENCECEDGKRRYVRITGEPDTFFSVPARVTVRDKGKNVTVTGYVTFNDDEPEFRANAFGKNGHLLKGAKDNEGR